MSDTWLRRITWAAAFIVIITLATSTVMLISAPDFSSMGWLGNLGGSIVVMGAPILGVIILTRQPRNRIGWLWIIYGLIEGIRSLGHGIYYVGGSQPAGYSGLEYFLLWSTEPANLANSVCLILLMLWFPDGQLPSRRWRILYVWLFLAVAVLSSSLFQAGPNWNGGAVAGGIVIDNPYGWLPANTTLFVDVGFLAFISIGLILILAVVSLTYRYRSATQQVRLQLRWFVLGGFALLIMTIIPVLVFGGVFRIESALDILLVLSMQASIIPLYLAIGVAILRYRLYDIDVIIRKTLVYAVVSGLLALVYFGMVVLLQSAFESVSGQQSPIAIVISTLVIAALFSPLRRRVQALIDRRFFRKKYDAQQVLAQFAQTARDETDMEALTVELMQVAQETMQPEGLGIWLKDDRS